MNAGQPPPEPQPASRLRRRLGLTDAVAVGVGSMLGTGVFVVFAPAAARAGSWLLLALLLAAAVAYANATSTADLAAVHPESGGVYAYGRHRLGPGWGALAGYAFVLGKIASCTAAALAIGAYAWPAQQRPVALAAVVATTALNLGGVTRTAAAARVLALAVLAVLAVAVLLAMAVPPPAPRPLHVATSSVSAHDVLGAAALLFFAFAGYARVATLGEEVRDPARTIPRAVRLALGVVLATYAVVALALLHALGPAGLAASTTPVADAVSGAGTGGQLLVRAGAAVAAGAVLLSLVAGVARTIFAMAAGGDLPNALAAVSARSGVPHRAELLVGTLTGFAVLGTAGLGAGGIAAALAFSACTVLVYYLLANACALRLAPQQRTAPPALPAFGALACATLALSLPGPAVLSALLALGTLCAARAAVRRGR